MMTLSNRWNRRVKVILGVLLAVLVGCPGLVPDPSFTLGESEDDFGTLDDGLGSQFQISPEPGSGFAVGAEGTDGEGGFVVDEFGRLVQLTTPAGSILNVEYLDDGSIRLNGFVFLLGQVFDFDVIVPANEVPIEIVDDEPGTEQTMCVSIHNFCEAAQDFLDVLLPLAEESLLQLAGVPSGSAVQDAVVVGVIDSLLDDAVGQVEGFCDAWDVLTVTSGEPCE